MRSPASLLTVAVDPQATFLEVAILPIDHYQTKSLLWTFLLASLGSASIVDANGDLRATLRPKLLSW